MLLLNKFNVVPHHLLLVTAAYAEQDAPLDAADLGATAACLRAFPAPGGLAFMNVGPESGFSQPHKHLQLLPLPFAAELPHAPVPIGPLVAAAGAAARAADGPLARFRVAALPFHNACALLADDMTPQQLADAVAVLVAAARGATGVSSHNLLLTREWAMVVPRRAERGCGVAVNALAFAGTMLVRGARSAHVRGAHAWQRALLTRAACQVRSADELARVRADPMAILTAAGVPW